MELPGALAALRQAASKAGDDLSEVGLLLFAYW